MSQQQPDGVPSQEYIEEIIQTGTDDAQHPREIADLLSQDYPLSNMTSADREFFRLKADNVQLFSQERFPPEQSVVQGEIGAALLDDPSYDRTSLDNQAQNRIKTALMEHFSRTSRAVGGWQQDKFTENITTNRVEDNRTRTDEASEDSGRLSGLFSK
jgi:hypothetical protein